jgi:hypothetical protein
METISVGWLRMKNAPDITQVPCKHWVFTTDGWDLKIDVPTATKFAQSIQKQVFSQTIGQRIALRRTFKVSSGRKVEFVLTRPAADVIVDAVLGNGSPAQRG